MNKVMIVDASESDRRLMSVLLVKHGYEPIAVDNIEAEKEEAKKLEVMGQGGRVEATQIRPRRHRPQNNLRPRSPKS